MNLPPHTRLVATVLVASACSSSPSIDNPRQLTLGSAPSSQPRESSETPSTETRTADTSAAPTSAPAPPPPPCPDGMVKVEGGAFEAGPLKRKASVDSFCVEATEVTAAAYETCVQAGKCSDFMLKCAEAATYQVPGKEKFPIVCVDFTQAKSYCEFRGMRLPSEQEWEWVARGGSDGRKFAWGNDPPSAQACWSGGPQGPRKGPCEVGSFPTGNGILGIVDLTGNVFEWTDSKADSAGSMLVSKGGSWRDGVAAQLSVSRPGGFKPNYRCGFGGMRCATSPAK